MARFVFRDKSIYYEEYGRGKPLIVLNGIMMSCASWKEFIEPFSARNRLILVDFLDQGKSDRMTGQEYDHAIQVEVVKELVDFLGLDKVCLMGISYGSEVAMEFTLKYPQHVERLLLFNEPSADYFGVNGVYYIFNSIFIAAVRYKFNIINANFYR